ncbi:MAG: ABC transporter permease [Proteobacteria bacterium]|nr:ABC transporter permease [Pseudomonadota bacterium]
MRNELHAVVLKELRQTFRDRRMLMLLVVAPVLQLTLLGYAVNMDVEHVATVVTDEDHSPASRALVRGMLADPTLRLRGAASDPVARVVEGSASVAVVVPRGFGARLTRGRPVQVQVLVDGTDTVQAQAAIDATTRFLQREALGLYAAQRWAAAGATAAEPSAPLASAPLASVPRVSAEPRLLYNPRLRSATYMVPGVAATVLLVITSIITAMSIARERELGTIEQLMVTPIRPSTLLLGKILPFAMIGLVVAGLVLAVGIHLFDVPVRGSPLLLLLGTALYLLNTLGTGVFISTMARTQQQAILGSFFFIMPAILLSGFMSPIANMPGWAQWLTAFNPVRYYIEVLRACLLKGAGFFDLGQPLAALAVLGGGILTLASLRFRKRTA